jgi:uncharacterized membrane protein
MNLLGRYGRTSTRARTEQALDLFAALIAGGLVVLVVSGSAGLLRVLLTLAFTFFVPGRAIVSNWPAVARWSAAAITIVLSLAVLSLLATVTLWAHLWHPTQLFEAEAALSLAGLGIGMVRRSSAVRMDRWERGDPSGAQ